MTEQELRDEFEKTKSKYYCIDFSRNEFGQYQGLENRVAFEYFKKGYSLAQETIKAKDNEIDDLKEILNHRKCGELTSYLSENNKYYGMEVFYAGEDCHFSAIKLIKHYEKSIAEAREIFKRNIIDDEFWNKKEAWLERNK